MRNGLVKYSSISLYRSKCFRILYRVLEMKLKWTEATGMDKGKYDETRKTGQ
jgi:hypothetical protein